MGYTKELKEAVLGRLLPPNNEPVSKLVKETGINATTIRRWRREAGYTGSGDSRGVRDKFSSRDKFIIVLETASMNELEISSYAREKGLFVEQIKQWRETCENANDRPSKSPAEFDKELRKWREEKKRLEREINRKDKALAETAALLTLSKKACAIWGGGRRGRMTDAPSRANIVSSVDKACKSGSTVEKACELLGISSRTYERWSNDFKTMGSSEDKRPLQQARDRSQETQNTSPARASSCPQRNT